MKLYVGFGVFDGLEHEPTLNVIEHPEVFLGLGDLNDVHDANGESTVAPDLVVDEDTSLLVVENERDFATVHGILESVLEQHGQRQRLAQPVGTLARAGGEDSTHLVQQPALGSDDTLKMFLRSSSHELIFITKVFINYLIFPLFK